MLIAKVTGSIVSTQKDDTLVGKKLMIVQPMNSDGEPTRNEEVACDKVGAGIGEYVLVTRGGSARAAFESSKENVIDMAIVAIIDSFDK